MRPGPKNTKLAQAERFLREILEEGEESAARIIDMALRQDFSSDTLSRAKRSLGVATRRKADGFYWSLPGLNKATTDYAITPGGHKLPIGRRDPSQPPLGILRDDVVHELPLGKTYGIIGDFQAPFHHITPDGGGALVEAVNALVEAKIDGLYLNGDVMDQLALSRHEPDLSKRDLAEELVITREILVWLRTVFPDIPIWWREGNHEERWWKHLVKCKDEELARFLNATLKMNNPNADDLAFMTGLELPTIMGLEELNIQWHDQRCKVKMGQLYVDHGHEFMGSGGVMPARAYLLKSMDNILVNHVHRTSMFTFVRPHSKKPIAGYSVGCLCDDSPHWFSRNSYNHGYAIVRVDDEGFFRVQNEMIM